MNVFYLFTYEEEVHLYSRRVKGGLCKSQNVEQVND